MSLVSILFSDMLAWTLRVEVGGRIKKKKKKKRLNPRRDFDEDKFGVELLKTRGMDGRRRRRWGSETLGTRRNRTEDAARSFFVRTEILSPETMMTHKSQGRLAEG